MMAQSVYDTSGGRVRVLLIVDPDDPSLSAYLRLSHDVKVLDDRLGYTKSLNLIAREVWDEHAILGAFGDDVIFRTPAWDEVVYRTLETPGIAYGDDLIHGANHPTAVFMSSVIAKALGWLALPSTTHQWADDGWKELGKRAGILRFMPEVIVEHMHPGVGKAEWDDTYQSVFTQERAERDHNGFENWKQLGGLLRDVKKVTAVL